MRVLVVSLLRMGDLIMALPGLKAVIDSQDFSEVDLLIHKESQMLVPMIPYVRKAHVLDRKELQDGLVLENRPVFESMDRLDMLIQKLNQENYDLVINLTHTKFSGWICGLIDAQDKDGLVLQPSEPASLGSSWFRYLNEFMSKPGSDSLHMTDVLASAIGIHRSKTQDILKETEKGRKEALSYSVSAKPMISVQVLSSDMKKDISLANWWEYLSRVSKQHPDHRIVFLCAPFEKDKLSPLMDQGRRAGYDWQLAPCSVEGAFSIIKESALLISVDTGIKHLAAATETPVIELALGSSDFQKTGVYQNHALIISGQASCRPCTHSSACDRPSHLCEEGWDWSALAKITGDYLRRNWKSINTQMLSAQQFRAYRTLITENGSWVPIELGHASLGDSVKGLLDKLSWRFYLSDSHKSVLPEFGSQSWELRGSIKWLYPEIDWASSEKQFAPIEKELEQHIQQARQALFLVQKLKKQTEGGQDFEELSSVLKVMEKQGPALRPFHLHEQPLSFLWLRRAQEFAEEVQNRNQIQLKLLKSLKTQITEMQ